MQVKAKFKCESVTEFEGGSEKVTLRAVTNGTPEDNTFSKYTPTGSMEMTVTNEAIYGYFKPGHKYYLDITEAAD